MIQTAHVALFAGGHIDERRHWAAQVQRGVQFECGLHAREIGPWAKRQAQVDQAGVESDVH